MYKLLYLQIETTTICNGHCKFCIHKTLPKYETMSDKLYLKILNDAKDMPFLKSIVPMMLGEPFCDKKIVSRLKLINKILPNKGIHIFTNGSLITPNKIKQLEKIKNLTVHFSLNGVDIESRERMMGLSDYEHVLKMINLYKKTKKPFETLIIRHPLIHQKELEKFKELELNPKIIEYRNWSGDKYNWAPQTKCTRAINTMTIMVDGRVNLCCMEHGKIIFGDTNTSSIKEVWESDFRQMYAHAHSFGKYLRGPCYNCTKA